MSDFTMTYTYTGPIKRFGSTVCKKWTGYTEASSMKQAVNNLKFQAKKYMSLDKTAKIEILENKVELVYDKTTIPF